MLAYAKDGKSCELDGLVKSWVYEYMSFSHSHTFMVLRSKSLSVVCVCEGC